MFSVAMELFLYVCACLIHAGDVTHIPASGSHTEGEGCTLENMDVNKQQV